MDSLSQRKQAFIKLGEYLRLLSEYKSESDSILALLEKLNPSDIEKFRSAHNQIEDYIEHSINHNAWFAREFLVNSIQSIGESLSLEKINRWLKKYEDDINRNKEPITIGVVMAGNLPLVGFHDYLSVLISGNRILGKLSKDDSKLLPLLHDILSSLENGLEDKAAFTTKTLKEVDAIIATGSDNTSRYFEYYFGKYPNIIRKNRNGVALLNGDESATELEGLADDVFMYFGLGCRNVSKLFLPRGYNFEAMFLAFEKYKYLSYHNKYLNNLDYNKSIFLINKINFQDNGFVILKEDTLFSSPISVIYYEYYDNIEDVKFLISTQKDKIQCIISNEKFTSPANLAFGEAQQPELWDYADGIDTLEFINNL